jgi:hypothetical protein
MVLSESGEYQSVVSPRRLKSGHCCLAAAAVVVFAQQVMVLRSRSSTTATWRRSNDYPGHWEGRVKD